MTSLLPPGWAWTTLGDIGTVVAGGTPSTADPSNFGGDIVWVTPADLSGYSAKHIAGGKRNLTQRGLDSCSATLLPKASVLMSSRAPVGYVAIAANPIATNQGFKNLILAAGIEPDYLYYYLKGNRPLLESYASGTTFMEVSARQFAKIPVALCSAVLQRRIVAKIEELFSQLDAGVEELKKAKAQLKRYRQSVLKAAFAAANWRWATVDEVCSAVVDCPHATPTWTTDGVICLRTTNFLPGRLDLSEVRYVTERTYSERIARLKPDSGDVLYSREGGILGIACLMPDGVRACLGKRMMLMRAKRDVYLPSFLMHYLNSSGIASEVRRLTGGSASPHLNVGDIKQFAVPAPHIDDQRKITSEIERQLSITDAEEKAIEAALKQAARLRQSILKRAFEGRLVPQDPSDEPADRLLERIRAEKAKHAAGQPRGRGRRTATAGK